MPIVVDIDVMMARRKMSVGELADRSTGPPERSTPCPSNR